MQAPQNWWLLAVGDEILASELQRFAPEPGNYDDDDDEDAYFIRLTTLSNAVRGACLTLATAATAKQFISCQQDAPETELRLQSTPPCSLLLYARELLSNSILPGATEKKVRHTQRFIVFLSSCVHLRSLRRIVGKQLTWVKAVPKFISTLEMEIDDRKEFWKGHLQDARERVLTLRGAVVAINNKDAGNRQTWLHLLFGIGPSIPGLELPKMVDLLKEEIEIIRAATAPENRLGRSRSAAGGIASAFLICGAIVATGFVLYKRFRAKGT